MKFIYGLILLTVFLVACSQVQDLGNPKQEAVVEEQQAEPLSKVQEQSSISSTELSIHNSENDCWTAYEGKVYDITDWLPKHPGSSLVIIPYCGTSDEFESSFIGQHGKSKVEKLMQEGTFKGDLV